MGECSTASNAAVAAASSARAGSRYDLPDEDDGPLIGLWCPVCAAAEFGYRPEVAANYVCAWEPVTSKHA